MEYIIVGDTNTYKECLVRSCGRSYENAVKTLDRMLHNPDKYDKYDVERHTNLRIKEVKDETCWWNDSFLAN